MSNTSFSWNGGSIIQRSMKWAWNFAGRRKYGPYLELLFGKEPDLSHALCSRCQFPWKSWSCYHPLNRHSGAQSSSCTRTTPHDCFQAYNLDPFLSYTSNRGIINYLFVTCKLYLNIFKQTLLFKGTRVSFWMEIDFWHQYTITILLLQLVVPLCDIDFRFSFPKLCSLCNFLPILHK